LIEQDCSRSLSDGIGQRNPSCRLQTIWRAPIDPVLPCESLTSVFHEPVDNRLHRGRSTVTMHLDLIRIAAAEHQLFTAWVAPMAEYNSA
jgi:hypothetical protein